MKRVFISYSRRNKAFAERLARDLDDAGLEVWIDFRQISGGELWQNEIFRGIERSEFVIFCMSPASIASEWCNREIMAAREQNKLIIPIMIVDAYDDLKHSENLSWILDVHFISFVAGYEQAYSQLLDSLPGSRPVGVYDEFDPTQAQNPFKGLEAFQQTDAHFFFGRERMIQRSLKRMQETRFLAFVGASGSGKSSLVRAGILPALRSGKIPSSETWRTALFTPGANPLEALVTRIMPYLQEDNTRTMERVIQNIQDPEIVNQYVDNILGDAPDESRLLIIIDQFEEIFTRASASEAQAFVNTLVRIATSPNTRLQFIVTMRADFFGSLSGYPSLAQLFEQQNMIIVTEMTAANIRRAIEGPVSAVGLKYEDGLVDRILDDVRSQPGSLPLLQYALRQLFDKRQGATLTHEAYDEVGGVRRALAQHAEEIYSELSQVQQETTRRLLLRLVEVGDSGEATRRRVPRSELKFDDIDTQEVDEVINMLTAAGSRLLIASREITTEEASQSTPITWLEVSHEALIREWDRFKTWVSSRLEDLQYSTELRKLSHDWEVSGRDPAYLLVGKRLTRAEVWIEKGDSSDLQRDYIDASLQKRDQQDIAEKERQQRELALERKNASRLRLLAVVLVIGFVGAIVAVIVAVTQNNELEAITGQLSQRTIELEEQSTVLEEQSIELARTVEESQSLALSAEADRLFSDRDTDLAIALGLQSTGITNPPIRVQSTLNNIALAAGTRRVIDTSDLTILSLAYNPDATQIVTGLDNGEIVIWNVATGRELLRWEAHRSGVNTVAYDPDGTRIVSGSDGTTNNLRVWDAASGEEIFTIPYHTSQVTSVKFTPDGEFFVSASNDQTYVVWRSETFEVAHSGMRDIDIEMVDVTEDLENDWVIAIADADTIVTVNRAWETETRITPEDFGLNADITSMRIKADGTMIIAGFETGEVGLWNARNGTLVQTFPSLDSRATAVDFLPRDDKVIAGFEDGSMRIWDVVTSRQTDAFTLEAAIRDLEVNSAEVRMAVSLEGQMRIWDIQGSAEVQRFNGHRGQVSAVTYHPDGELILSGSFDTTLILWDNDNAEVVQTYIGHDGAVVALDFNAEGSRFISSANDQTARIWVTETAEITLTFDGHNGNITSVAWHPSSSLVATGGLDNRILLWDANTGEIQQELLGHDGSVASLQFSQDGTMLLSGSFDDTLKVWDIETGEDIRTLSGHTGSVFAGSFNDDATQVISGASDRTVRIWDVDSARELRRLEGHDRIINQVAFVSESDAVLSASSDGTLRLWDTTSGFEIYRYTVVNSFGRSIAMRAVAVKSNGDKAVTGMSDSTVREWEILPTINQLIRWTLDNRFIPTLDCNEQILFGLQSTLDMGQQVFISSPDESVNLLFDPTQGAVTGIGSNGEAVDLIDIETLSDGRNFYEVCTASGQVGWIEETLLDGVS